MKTGKTYWGPEQIGEKERQRERIREKEKQHWWKEEMAWVEMTVGEINT